MMTAQINYSNRSSIDRQRMPQWCLMGLVCGVILALAGGTPPSLAQASLLDDCRALSVAPADIHNCMDNFLDQFDQNMSDLEGYIVDELGGGDGRQSPAVQAFERAQAAFRDFRRENCLWYLEFSTPREAAEQIAKNCLAEMSRSRVDELQRLISGDQVDAQARGYYVYGAERNTLQLCGGQARLWVEGEAAVVGELQQGYLSAANRDKALMYVVLSGKHATEEGSPYPDHDGVFRLTSVIEIRPPGEGDCQLPTSSRRTGEPVAAAEPVEKDNPQETDEVENEGEAPAGDETTADPEQQLTAYFGAWVAECTQLGDSYGCIVSTVLETNNDRPPGKLILTRRSRQRTIIDLSLPDQKIEDTRWIEWQIDTRNLGEVLPSRVEHNAEKNTTTQMLRDRSHIQNEIFPLLAAGVDFKTTVSESPGSETQYHGTLIGLTRAIQFADDFTVNEGQI